MDVTERVHLFLLLTIALAITCMSSSVPAPLRALQPHKMNRQLFCAYPSFGSMRSKLGEKGCGPFFSFLRNGIPVISQFPVQRAVAHSKVRLNSIFLAFASYFRDLNR